jgi:hypothetical protein
LSQLFLFLLFLSLQLLFLCDLCILIFSFHYAHVFTPNKQTRGITCSKALPFLIENSKGKCFVLYIYYFDLAIDICTDVTDQIISVHSSYL